ncbi:UNVERIFIED_CONTAM: putative disease resistance protein RGA4 [Sesamum radiatum]|uniref:Disease resistance protein RGA4 n=1 Tax=Sesamum radiatum TaxID=300843 RepID=A0AAW2TIF5_SESRA
MMLSRQLERVAAWVNTLARFSRDHVGSFLKMVFVVTYTVLLTWALFPATSVLESAGLSMVVSVVSLADDQVFGVKLIILLCAGNLYFGEECFILKAGLIICAFSVSIFIASYTILLTWAVFPASVPVSAGYLSMSVVDSFLADDGRGNGKEFVAKLIWLCAATAKHGRRGVPMILVLDTPGVCFLIGYYPMGMWSALVVYTYWVFILVLRSLSLWTAARGITTGESQASQLVLGREFLDAEVDERQMKYLLPLKGRRGKAEHETGKYQASQLVLGREFLDAELDEGEMKYLLPLEGQRRKAEHELKNIVRLRRRMSQSKMVIKTDRIASSAVSTVLEEREEEKIISEAAASEVQVDRATPEKEECMAECLLYCALFPAGYEFTRDTLVWSWIAAGLIESDDMEAVAIRCFDTLMQSEYILHSGYNHLRDQTMYKLGEKFLNKQSVGVRYKKGLDSETDVADVQHLSLILEGIDRFYVDTLRKCGNLKTLLLHRCSGSELENLLHNVLLELISLTILDLSRTNIVELPSSVEKLTGLRYLDLSETPIRRLPEWMDSLCNLETLILLGCLNLCGLPKCMYKLIKLQHLVLDIVQQLQSMPIGMGKLTNLQTLRAFLVGTKDGNRVGELRNMNKLKGSLCILKLENILNVEEARNARLCDKLHLTKLELIWSDLQDGKVETEEEIVEYLQPHFGLQELKIVSYSGGVLPSWISDPSFTQLVSITLHGCRYCETLPSLGELPSLKILNIVDMDELVVIDSLFYQKQANQYCRNAFPRLEQLSFDGMSNLEIWTGMEDGHDHFPCLQLLMIRYCPRLRALPSLSYLNSLQHLEICYCPEIPCLPEGGLPTSLNCLMVKTCPKLKDRCCNEQGEDWAKVMNVPTLYIDNQKIHSKQ